MTRRLQKEGWSLVAALLTGVTLLVAGQGCAIPAASAPQAVWTDPQGLKHLGGLESAAVTTELTWPTVASARAASLPAGTLALATLNRWGLTTLVALTSDGALAPLTESHAMDDTQVALAGETIAHLVLRGPDPADNLVEVINGGTGQSWQVAPAPGYAIFGFTLAPEGSQLAYLEVDLRGLRRPVPWQVVLIASPLPPWLRSEHNSELAPSLHSGQALNRVKGQALAAGTRQIVLRSDTAGGPAQMPFAWSGATGELLLKGIIPYQAGGGRGVWAVRLDGSGLRQVLPEAEYVGQPRLSHDGSRLAFFASDPGRLRPGKPFRPGAPAPNALWILNLATGQKHPVARSESGLFGDLAWSQDDSALLVSHGEWADGPVRFREVIAIAEDDQQQVVIRLEGEQPGSITALHSCGDDLLLAIRHAGGAELWRARGAREAARLLELTDGELGVIDCLKARRGG